MYNVVIDTNVIISALKSSRGASHLLLSKIGLCQFTPCLSVPLILEYEEVIRRLFPQMKQHQIDDLLNYLCAVSEHIKINYLWRPYLKDPCDDMVLEVAVNASASYILTYNKNDFTELRTFAVQALTPKEFLEIIGVLP